MAKQKQELAVIDFTQFSVAQLPELKGKKEEIASVIEANPIVEIVDNATYESAKKSRTAVRTLRTSLEKEGKDVEKKIKDHVLGVIKKEYDTLVSDVKSAEDSRQSPIDAWEKKKEEEKQEKARLEQERIDGIKTKISDYVASWKEAFGFMVFGSIKEVSENFAESNANFDKNALQEFDVLFDREVSTLTELLENKISTLKEQEQIRVDNLLIQEKNAEQTSIQEWQRTWNANIDSLSFGDIADVKSILVKSKLVNLKHYVSGYEEIYLSTEKRLHSQIEFVSKAEEQRIMQVELDKERERNAEEQRIAQEKLDQEKKEFEQKQAEVKFQERKKFLVDEGYWNIYFTTECFERESTARLNLLNFDENGFENFKLAVLKAKEPIEAIEVVAEEVVEMPLLEIDEIANHDAFIQEVEFEETWDSIYHKYMNSDFYKFNPDAFIIQWFKENYNVPTEKQ